MKVLKWSLYVIGTLFLLVLLIALFMPSKYEVERSITIERHPETVYKKVATLEEWPKWNPWSQGSDSNVFKGPQMGEGAVWERWTDQGKGKLQIIEAEPYKKLRTKIHSHDSTMTMKRGWKFEPDGSKTKVTWRVWGDPGYPIERILAPFMADAIGDHLEKGLQNLKKHTEEEVPMSARRK